ncbi:MAG TPA: ThuA domain-containing protein, partial [Desulfuromonadaceae bacterium]|nr:ThuA domain-containing protein [Desulfuromonadaceae bacterium]
PRRPHFKMETRPPSHPRCNPMKRIALALFLIATCGSPVVRAADAPAKISVLIVDGMNNHDWQRGTRLLKRILEDSGMFAVDVSTSPTNGAPPEQWDHWRPAFARYQVVVNNFNSGYKTNSLRWPHEVEKSFEDYVAGGGGLVNVHAANNSFPLWPAYNEMIGLGWRDKNFGPSLIVGTNGDIITVPAGQGNASGHGKEHDFQITVMDHDHPITRGMPDKWMHPLEQLTHGQRGPATRLHVLDYAWAADTDENELMDWVSTYGKGRVYTTMLGHLWKNGPDTTLRCVGFQTLLIRGTEWAATGKVTWPVPKDFPTATEIKMRTFAEDAVTMSETNTPVKP